MRFLKGNIWLAILLGISILGHWYVFFDFKNLNAGDWVYHYPQEFNNFFYYNIYYSFADLGSVSAFANNWVFYIFYYLLGLLGVNWDIGTRILFLVPSIILTPIFSFAFFKKVLRKDVTAFVASCLYVFNTFFLKLQLDWLTHAFMWWVLPALLLCVTAYLANKEKRYLAVLALLTFIGMVFEVRIMLLLLVFTFIYQVILFFSDSFPLRDKIRKHIQLGIGYGLGIATNLFWLLPSKLGGLLADTLKYASPNPFQSYYDLLDVLTLHMYSWSHNYVLESFIRQPIDIQYFLIPLFIMVGIVVFKKDKYNYALLAPLLFLYIVYVFLAKQNFSPFGTVYTWLFYNVPLFNLYRESSKFYVFVALIASLFFSIGVVWLFDYIKKISQRTAYLTVILIVFFTSVFNLQHYLDQGVGGMARGEDINIDYKTLASYLANDKDYYRVLWLPTRPRYGYYSVVHPYLNAISLPVILAERINFALFDRSDSVTNQLKYFFNLPYSSQLMDKLSVRYVVVPIPETRYEKKSIKEINEKVILYEHYGEYEGYVGLIDSVPYLKKIKIAGINNLLVYENNSYKKPIWTFSSLIGLSSEKFLNDKYNFINDNHFGEFNYVVSLTGKTDKVPAQKLVTPFEAVTANSIKNNMIFATTSTNSFIKVFQNIKNNQDISYRFEDGKLELFNNPQNRLILDDTSISDNSTSTFFSEDVGTGEYFLAFGNRIFSLVSSSSTVPLGTMNSKTIIYKASGANTVKDGSFEDGLWQNQAGDCNAHNGRGDVSMSQSKISVKGNYSLGLSAVTHIACTEQNIGSLKPDQDYIFSFSYKSSNSKEAGFYVGFKNQIEGTTTATIEEHLPVDKEWKTFKRIIRTPGGVNSASLVVYAFSVDQKTDNTVYYDNFTLIPVEKISEIEPMLSSKTTSKDIVGGKITKIAYEDKKYEFNNLIKNGSLEDGLWNSEVGDCNNNDESPIIGQSIENATSSEGRQSLMLFAQKHIACSGPPPFELKENSTYLLSFDYESPNSSDSGYYLGYKGTDNINPINKRISVLGDGWKNFSQVIHTPDGVTGGSFVVYSYATDGIKKSLNRYDNFSLIEIPDIASRYYLFGSSTTKSINPETVTLDSIGPVKKVFHIKNAYTAFYLAMSENFHSKWQAELNNAKSNGRFTGWVPWVHPDKIQDDYHFKLDGFLNGWYVDPVALCGKKGSIKDGCTLNPDGSYNIDLIIEFTPQRWFYVGLIISGTTLLSCLLYLGYDFVKRKRKIKKGIKNTP